MSNLQNILMSFHSKENLNSKIWGDDDEMNPKVRERLLEIANQFIEYLKVDIIVSDIVMTGSLANFNWSEYSDIDLHILADFTQFPEDQLPLYEDLFKLKKTIFNDKHDITIFGYEVELYVQNEEESHFSSGVYSVLNDEWVSKPEKESVEIDTSLIKSKIEQWMKTIDTLIKNVEGEPIEVANKMIDKLKDKIKKYRTCGLEKGGEYSDENLVFKALRRNGYIEKLFDYQTKHTDKELSLKEQDSGSSFSKKENKELDTKIELAKKSTFLEDLKKIAKSNKEYKNLKQPGQEIPYQKEVEFIQTGLQFLGYSLPKWGVDGLFGPETEGATKDFKKEYGLSDDGVFNPESLKHLYAVLVNQDFSDEDLAKIVRRKEFNLKTSNPENTKISMEFLIKKGLTEEQAAGIVGNLYAESGLNPSIEGDGGTSLGIAQWHNERKTSLIDFCKSKSEDPTSLLCQLNYLWYELTNEYPKVLAKIKSSTTSDEVAKIFANDYERPLSKDYTKRITLANNILDDYSQNA